MHVMAETVAWLDKYVKTANDIDHGLLMIGDGIGNEHGHRIGLTIIGRASNQ